jgi:hypothetical protein
MDRGSSPGGVRIFSSPNRPDRLWGATQPPIEWVQGALSPRIKRPGREAEHSPPTSAEVKKIWIYTSTPLYAFVGQLYLDKMQMTSICQQLTSINVRKEFYNIGIYCSYSIIFLL